MDLREQIRIAIGGALAAQEGSDGAAGAVMEVLAKQPTAAWCATDETGTVVEALGMNQSRRFDTALYLAPGAQPAPSVPREAIEKMLTQLMDIAVSNGANSVSMPDEYVEVAAWLCGIPAQPAPSVPECWLPVPEKHPTFDPVDLQLSDGSVLCGCVPQSDGDYWWEGPSGEVFIDPKYASVTHWRLAAAPEAKP